MMRSARLLTVGIVAALALPPSPSHAQQWWRQPQKAIPGGPLIGALPELKIDYEGPVFTSCIGSFKALVSFTAVVENFGDTTAVMTADTWGLGPWVKVTDMNESAWGGSVDKYAYAPPWSLPPKQKIKFPMEKTAVVLCQADRSGCLQNYFKLNLTVDPANRIKEKVEKNNDRLFSFYYDKNWCK
jgi:hypothetical protein